MGDSEGGFVRSATKGSPVTSTPKSKKFEREVLVGWREWAQLPDLAGVWVKAKVDTGARTSALHAFDMQEATIDGETRVQFMIHPWQKSSKDATPAEAVVIGHRSIRSSSGAEDLRPIIRTLLQLGVHSFEVEISLTRRDDMGFRMLIGREALRRRATIDPGRSYITGKPPADVLAANRSE